MATPLISTANLGSWDYYIMSDNTAIWRAMNGLASWFGGQGGLIQNAAWMGALMLLVLATFNAAIRKSSAGAAQIGGWFFFMTTMGMTGTANIINIYSGTITTVANVPALVLVPASMFSKAGYKVFTTMETAFQATTGSYMSISQNAFVGPLDLLLALRSPKLPAAIPALNQTLVQVVYDCGENPDATAAATVSLKDAPDILAWFKTYGRTSGITTIYTETDTTGAGTISSCGNAFIYLDTQYAALAAGNTALTSFLNAETKKRNPQTTSGLWGASNLTNSFDFVVGAATGMTQTSLQFTKNALTAGTVTYTMDCIKSAGMMTTPENCQSGAMALADSMERYKTDAAMAGSGFLKTMFTSMGFLQVMFFALFPFIALYGLIVVNKTLSVFGSYILFGIWAQSWLLVVAPIQSYIQTSVVDEMNRIVATSHGVTMANMMAVYQELSTKLALAGDLMANSQMLSLALLSGSIYAMTGMVGKWSGSQHHDGSMLQQKVSESAPIIKNNPMISAGAMSTSGSSGGGSITSLDSIGSTNYALDTSFIKSRSETSNLTNTEAQTHQRAKQFAASLNKTAGFNVSEKEAASILHSMDAVYGGSAGISAGIAKDLVGSIFKGKSLSPQQAAAAEKTAMQAQGQAVSKLAAKDDGFIAKLSSNDSEVKAQAWASVADTAMDVLTVGAVGLEIASGVGAPAAGATMAASAVAKKGVVESVKGFIRGRSKDPTHAGENAAIRALGKGRDIAAGIADAVAGNTDASMKAAFNDSYKKTFGSEASKSTSKDEKRSATQTDGVVDAYNTGKAKSFSQSAGQGVTDIAKMTLTNDGLNRMAVNGTDGQSGDALRKNAALTAANIRNGQLLKSNGSRFSNEEIAQADKAVTTMMSGHATISNDPNVNAASIDSFKKNVLFEQVLTGQVSGSFGQGNGLSRGANIATTQPNTVSTDSHPAVAATKGHWAKSNVAPNAPRNESREKFDLNKWGDGDDPANQQRAQQATKAGMRWVPGRKGSDAVEGSTRLAPDQSQAFVNLPQNVNRAGVGGDFANGKDGTTEFQRVAQSVVDKGVVAQQKDYQKALPADQALEKLDPSASNRFSERDNTIKNVVAAGAAVTAVAGVAGEILRHAPTPQSSQSTGGARTRQGPRPGKNKQAIPASPAPATPVHQPAPPAPPPSKVQAAREAAQQATNRTTPES